MNNPNLSYPNVNNNNYIKRKKISEELFLEKKSNLLNKIKLLNKSKNYLRNKLKTLAKTQNEENTEKNSESTNTNKKEKEKKYKLKLENKLKSTMLRTSDFHVPKKKNVDDFTSYLDFLGRKSKPSNISKFNYFTAMKYKED